MKGKCDCCGKEGMVWVAASPCGAISFAYCEECLTSGREPYDAVVARLYGIDSMEGVAEWFKPSIHATLKAEGKTTDELFQDVEAFGAEYEEAIANDLTN